MLSKIWNVTKKVGSFILRRGPIIAAGIVGLGAIPSLGPIVQQVLGALGIFGISPNPDLSVNANEFVVQITLLIGAVRKLWAIFKVFKASL